MQQCKHRGPSSKVASLTIRRLPLSKLKPHPRNPRQHPDPGSSEWETLRKSLTHDYFDPIVWNKRNGMLVSGHLRTKVLADSSYTEADCVVVDYDENTHIARMIAANKLTGDDDEKALTELLLGLRDQDFDLDLTGFDADALSDVLNVKLSSNPVDAEPKLGKLAELQRKWKTARGQLWALGPHRLLCGDALDPESWKRLGGPFWFCLADPPYELTVNVATFRSAAKRDLLLMATDKLFLQQSATGFRTFFCYTFDSPGSALWTTTPMRKHTLLGWWRWLEHKSSFKGLDSVIHHAGQNQEAHTKHGQAKPLMLPASFLPYFTTKDEPFADAFAGAGSTLMAAENLSRQARSVELSPE